MAKFVKEDDPRKVDASPTKSFFVEIITKDIQLDEAIQDLIDNCVDGAKRMRPDSNFEDLEVDVQVSEDRLVISDNCGGIPLDIARKYAFKFGRAEGFEKTSHSVGQFGIGMKRALFKMGQTFDVSSTSPNAKFKITVNVEDWLADDESWDFDIAELEEKGFEESELGTTLEISNLAAGVADRFRQQTFIANLRNDIRAAHQHPMQKGLTIKLNQEAIIPNAWKLKIGEGMVPAFQRYEDDLGGESRLITRLYAGVFESNRQRAGWYIFCNGRCILEANQESTTGWSEVTEAGVKIPKYHGQFARFRGYAFLDSDDASILPWNTTKTGLDQESPAYRRLKPRLVEVTRPIIDFLNELDAEKDFIEADRSLHRSIAKASSSPLEKLVEKPSFTYRAPPKKGPPMSTISYKKSKAECETLKDVFGASSLRELGESSFEFSYDNLVEE